MARIAQDAVLFRYCISASGIAAVYISRKTKVSLALLGALLYGFELPVLSGSSSTNLSFLVIYIEEK